MTTARSIWFACAVALIAVGLAPTDAQAHGCCGGGGAEATAVEAKECGLCGEKAKSEACQLADKAAAELKAAGIGFVSAQGLREQVKAGNPPVIVDVLPRSSYTKLRVKGAVSIPVTEIADLAPKVLPDKTAEIVVYCGSYRCAASVQAAKELKALGYENVHDFKAGIRKWAELGYPVEGSEAQ